MNNKDIIFAEQGAIGSVLINALCFKEIKNNISEKDFLNNYNKKIIQLFFRLDEKNIPIDLHSLLAELQTYGEQKKEIVEYILEIHQKCSTSAGIEYYVNIIKETSTLRKLYQLFKEGSRKIKNNEPLYDIISFIEDGLKNNNNSKENLDPSETAVFEFLKSKPPDMEFILKNILPKNIVGGIIGMGGVSKSHLIIALIIGIATGQTILNHFHPVKPFKVLGLFAEDSHEELHRRVFNTSENFFNENKKKGLSNLLLENLHLASVVGQIGPLMELRNNNPVYSPWFFWLKRTIEAHQGLDVLILDPKSRFFGLEENSNEHNTAWITALEGLAREYRLTILFTHHANKASKGGLSQLSSRGGSALVDGCRWIANLKTMDETTAKKYDVDPRSYVEFDISKNNYAPSIPNTLYFKREKHGILKPTDLTRERQSEIAKTLCELLYDSENPISRRELISQNQGKNIRAQLGCKRAELNDALDLSLKEGWIWECPGISTGGRPRKNLIVKDER